MNQTSEMLSATLRGAGWGLPWLSVMAISAIAAYAVTVAIAGAPFGDASTNSAAPHTPAQAEFAVRSAEFVTTPSGVFGSSEVCDTTGGLVLHVGFTGSIPAEAGAARCPDGIP